MSTFEELKEERKVQIADLVPKSHQVLRTKCEKFNVLDPQMDPAELAWILADTMKHYRGLGLAAPQIGYPYRVFAINTDPVFVAFNPVIVSTGVEQVELEEGCLTFPNLYLRIKRPRNIKIRFAKPNGSIDTYNWSDMTARVAQHECDHLDGVLFTKHVSRLALEMAEKKARKLKRGD